MEGTELIAIEEINITKIFAEGDVDPMLEKLAAKARDFTPDTSTKKGRDEIKSRSAKVSNARAMFDKLRKESIAKHMEIVGKVNESGKKIQDFTADLRDEVREPLTNWESEEKKRIEEQAKLEEHLASWEDAIEENILFDRKRELDRKEEELKRQEEEKQEREEKERLEKERIENEERLEKERIEREERLKKEAEERANKKAEEEIARNKEILEKEKRDAEERETKAKADAEKAEKDRIEAIRKADEDKKIASEKAEKDKQVAVEVQKQLAKEREEKIEKEKQDAIKEVKRKAKVKADKLEQQRIEKEFAEQEERERIRIEDEERAADLEHRKQINNEALKGLVSVLQKADSEPNVEDIGKAIITAIATGQIAHTSIKY